MAKNQHFRPVWKSICWIEKWSSPFRIVTTPSVTLQSLVEINVRAPAVWCENMLGLPARGGQFERNIVSWFMGRFWCCFHHFFRNCLPFQKHQRVLVLVARWRYNFHEIAVDNCQNSRNRRKSLCAQLHIDNAQNLTKFYLAGLSLRTQMGRI